jgi:hypothetical protein
MGRWAQQRRRGTGTEEPPAPPPALPRITQILWLSDFTAQIAFDLPVTIDAGATFDALDVNGIPLANVSQGGPSTADAEFGAQIIPGDPWTLSAQPSWVVEAIHQPDSGVLAVP